MGITAAVRSDAKRKCASHAMKPSRLMSWDAIRYATMQTARKPSDTGFKKRFKPSGRGRGGAAAKKQRR